MVNKIVFRSLKKNGKLFAAIFILFTLATVILSLSDLTYNNLDRSNIEFKNNSNREDFRAYYSERFLEDAKDAVGEIDDKYNLTSENVTYIREEENSGYVLNVYPYEVNQKFDKLTLAQGRYPEKSSEIVVTESLFTNNEMKLDDQVTVSGKTYQIVGTVYAPEYTMPWDLQSNGSTLGPDMKGFGAGYVYADDFKITDDATTYYRFQFNDNMSDSKQKQIRDEISKNYNVEIPQLDANDNPQIDNHGRLITKELAIFKVVPSSLNMALTAIDMDVSSGKTMFNILGAIIMLLALALTVILMQTIFKSQRREIGILKAEGITNRELKISYLGYLGIALILAQVTGIIIAAFAAPILTGTFMDYYSFPIISQTRAIYGPLVSKLLIILIIVMIAVYFVAVNTQLKKRVLMLIKNIDTEKKPQLNISKLTKKMSFAHKYQINILIRNFSKTILLTFGIIVSSFLLLQGTLILNGINDITNIFNDGTINYDYIALYDTYQPKRTVDTAFNVETNIDNNDETKVELFGFDPSTKMMNLKTTANKPVERQNYQSGGVISDRLAQKLDVDVGDELTMINPYQQDEIIKLKINAIVSDPLNDRVYLDLNQLQSILDLQSEKVNVEMGSGKTKKEVLANDKNATYLKVDDLSKQLDDQMEIVYKIVGIIATIASIVAVVTLITITIIIINNNRKTISVMKVLGYTNQEIKKIITAPYRIIVIVVYFVSIPLIQKMITSLIYAAFADADFQLNVQIDFQFALLGFIVIYLIYEISMYFAYRVIKKISLAESLKVDE